jgi:DNA-binding response OmpR family regulator
MRKTRMKRILFIDPYEEDMENVSSVLESAGFALTIVNDSKAGLRKFYQMRPDTVIVDGISDEEKKLCSHIRSMSDIPIVVLGNGGGVTRATMLEHGADVYLERKWISKELLARVNSLLRRYHHSIVSNPRLDVEKNRVELGGRTFKLTPTEFRLFSCLAFNEGKVVLYSEIIDNVWGGQVSMDTVHLYFRRLKKRFGIDSVGSYRLLKFRGEGYCFWEDKDIPERMAKTSSNVRRKLVQSLVDSPEVSGVGGREGSRRGVNMNSIKVVK